MSEHHHQAALVKWAGIKAATDDRYRWLFAVPNAAKRSRRLAAIMKAEGLKAGVPDLIWPVASGEYHGMAIEMKYGRNKPTKAQYEWMAALKRLGWHVVVCYDWVEAAKEMEVYLGSA